MKTAGRPMPSPWRRLLDDGRARRLVLRLLYAACALALLADLVVDRHASRWWEAAFGFYVVFTLLACVALVLLGTLLRRVVRRSRGYDT